MAARLVRRMHQHKPIIVGSQQSRLGQGVRGHEDARLTSRAGRVPPRGEALVGWIRPVYNRSVQCQAETTETVVGVTRLVTRIVSTPVASRDS